MAIAVGLMLATTCGVREDELRCEEAVAHLRDCCPGFVVSSVSCTYDTACGIHYPAFTVAESACIADSKCSDVVQRGICQRATNQGARFCDDTKGQCDPNRLDRAAVCP